MEILRGKQTSFISTNTFTDILCAYDSLHLDLGTGDGRFVQHRAQSSPRCFVVGVDASRDNLRAVSRRAPANALFIIANAEALPPALAGRAAGITVNFPWGSLLTGLLAAESAVLAGLRAAAQPGAGLDIRLNAGALAEAGWSLAEGAAQAQMALAATGFLMRPPAHVTAAELRAFPTTWARRLAFGRDPRALHLRGAVP
jgi:16S rRNA (adenine(1408)-N(1))-methyltransferase